MAHGFNEFRSVGIFERSGRELSKAENKKFVDTIKLEKKLIGKGLPMKTSTQGFSKAIIYKALFI